MNLTPNRRVLLIDDLPSIHDDFRSVLGATAPVSALAELEAVLLGNAAPEPSTATVFEMDSAYQGSEALQLLKEARQDGRPYALAFVDARMPPGWDGVETVERLWQEDPDLQIVFCATYSDHAWPAVLSRLDLTDRLLILKKPIVPLEVFQMASVLTTKWTLAHRASWETDRQEPLAGALGRRR
jgi:CheY-like chemotaxis protein